MNDEKLREGFTNGKARIATEHDVHTARWNGLKPGEGFRCYLCGYRFQVGDYWRWQYYSGPSINFKVCERCDGPDVCARWKAHAEEFYSDKFWALRGADR